MTISPCWLRTTATSASHRVNRPASGAFTNTANQSLTRLVCVAALGVLALSGCSDSSLFDSKKTVQPPVGDASLTQVASTPALQISVEDQASAYVGSVTCGQCHQAAFDQWQQSHHSQSMAHPTAQTVKGDFASSELRVGDQRIGFSAGQGQFAMRLDGHDGGLEEYRVAYTFGTAPLQQYLTDMGGGRLQALPVVWDARGGGQGWYHLQPYTAGQPNDVLHWTGSGQNWNHMCADCHSTSVTKGFDAARDTYTTQFTEVSVGCEACHGPGAKHSESPSQFSVVSLQDPKVRMDVCASCHSRRNQVAEGFRPGANLLDHYVPSLLDEGLYYADGQILDEVFVYGSFIQSEMHHAGVTCSDCHTPHSAQLQRQGNDVCTACHSPGGSSRFPGLQSKVYDSVDHHFHAVSTLGTESTTVGLGSACVDCHMTARTYMGIDDRRDHSFRLPRPDLSSALGVPNACNICHEDRSSDWAAERLTSWFGTKSTEHFAHALAAAQSRKRSGGKPLMDVILSKQLPSIVRATGLSLLGQYAGRGQDQSQAEALGHGLRHEDPLVRLGALRGLLAIGPERWRALMPLLRDPLRGVRFAAVSALLPSYRQLPPSARTTMDQALDEYLKYLDANTDRAESLTSRALVHEARGDVKTAEADLLLALQRNPAWVPGLVNLADLYRATNRDVMAGELLQQALALSPQGSQVRVAMALWHVRQGNLAKGIETLAEGYANSLDAGSAYVYAVALNSAGQPERAMTVVDDLLNADLHNLQVLQLGISLARQNRSMKRLGRYQLALRAL
jgi:tetratricopeptide (TPR) repeat protein